MCRAVVHFVEAGCHLGDGPGLHWAEFYLQKQLGRAMGVGCSMPKAYHRATSGQLRRRQHSRERRATLLMGVNAGGVARAPMSAVWRPRSATGSTPESPWITRGKA